MFIKMGGYVLSEQAFPFQQKFICEDLRFAWQSGWLDSFSPRHFLICSINNDFIEYRAYNQTLLNSPRIYSFNEENFCINFCINFSIRIGFLIKVLGESITRGFFENQVSAGKENYDEAQFFRALSEIELIRHYYLHNNKRVKNIFYEPPLGPTSQNPEFRIEYEDGYIIDVEVKTSSFDNIDPMRKVAVPTVLLSDTGRNEIAALCKQHDIECIMPRVLKLRDRINESVDKFQEITNDEHFNLLFINWTYSDFASNGYLEAYSLLANSINGIFYNKKSGLHKGLHEDVYRKISAIIVYSSPIESIVFLDFRYLWATKAFAILPNPHLDKSRLNRQKLFKVTGMDSTKNTSAPHLMANMQGDKSVEALFVSSQLCTLVEEHALGTDFS